MKSLFALMFFALACNTSDDDTTIDAGVPISIVAPSLAVVTANGTTSIELVVDSDGNGPARITLGPLPSGLTCPPFMWTGQSPVSLTLTASADAPVMEVITNITATVDGATQGSAQLTIDVSSLNGALDPTFGDAGFWTLPLLEPASASAIALAPNDAWLVSGAVAQNGSDSVLLARVTSNGSLDSIYATQGVLGASVAGSAVGLDVDANGNAIVVVSSTSASAIVVDAEGTLKTTIPAADASNWQWVGWDNGGAFIAGANLVHLDAAFTPTSFALDSLDDAATALLVHDGSAYVATAPSGLENEYVARWSQTQPSVYAIDPTFGGMNGAALATLNTTSDGITALAIDSQNRILAAMSDVTLDVFRVLPNGELDASFGTDGAVAIDPRVSAGLIPVQIFPQENGTILVVANMQTTVSATNTNGILMARLEDNGAIDTTFGTYGLTRTLPAAPLLLTGAAYDASTQRVCTVSDANGSTSSIVMTCYHVDP